MTALEHDNMVAQIATELHRMYPTVERSDLSQQLWVWVLEHPGKIQEYEEDGQQGEKRLATALKRYGRAYATVQKAQASGYETADEYYYSTAQIRELLPQALDRSLWVEQGLPVDTGKLSRTSPIAEGNNRLAMLCDVREAWTSLGGNDRSVTFVHFAGVTPLDEHSQNLGITEEALRTRLARAIARIQRKLGGPRPNLDLVPRRRTLSNAQAQAITQMEMGEG